MSIKVKQMEFKPKEEEEVYPKPSYAWFVVGVLMLAYISSFVDRQILSFLVDDIKRDLGVTDVQVSLLMGLSFAIFYTVLGLPIGRMADNRSRRNIIMVGVLIWSLMTAVCGIAKNYTQLFLARVGVGVGEAALSPAAYSMITDYFPPKRLAFALSVYSMGIYIGSGMAFLLGGTISEWASKQQNWELPLLGTIYPWQVVFLIIGLPGLLITLLMFFVKEPERKGISAAKVGQDLPIKEAKVYFFKNWKMVIFHNFGFGLQTIATYGSAYWIPAFLTRTVGWGRGDAGFIYGWIVIIFATSGILLGGRMADYLVNKGNLFGRQTVMIWGMFGLMLASICIPFLTKSVWLIPFLIMASFSGSFGVGTATAIVQSSYPSKLRSLASAVFLLMVNLLGMATGPTLVAMCTQYFFKDVTMVGFSLSIVSVGVLLLGMLFIYLSRKPYRACLAQVEALKN